MDPITNLILLFFVSILLNIIGAMTGSIGFILIPVLMWFGLPPHTAIGTFRLAMFPVGATTVHRYHGADLIDKNHTWMLLIILPIASLIGAHFVFLVDEAFIKKAIAIIIFFFIILLLSDKKIGMVAEHLKSGPFKTTLGIVLMCIIGLYGGAFGAGAVTLFMMMHVLLHKHTFLKGIAHGMTAGLIISIVAGIVFVIKGAVSYPHLISLGLGGMIGAWIGAHIAVKKGNKLVRYALITMMTITGIAMVFF